MSEWVISHSQTRTKQLAVDCWFECGHTQNYTTLDCTNDWQLLIFSTPGAKGSWLLPNEVCLSLRCKHASGNSHPQRGRCAVITVTLRHSSAIEFFTGLRKRLILLRSSWAVSQPRAQSHLTAWAEQPRPRDPETVIEKQGAESCLRWMCYKPWWQIVIWFLFPLLDCKGI